MRLSERRKSRAFAHFSHSKSLLLNVTRIYLVIVAFWGEFGIFKSVLWSCHWPKLNDAAHLTTHVLLLSDPQIRYAASWHETWSIERVLFDLNLRKSWHVARQLRPDVTIMMGDMLAQGKSVKDEASYERYANHFHDLFQAPSRGKLYYIPGNNDVGMGSSASRLSPSRQHFQQHFGPLNQIFSIRNHTLVLLDSPGLVDEDYQRSARGSSFDDWIPLSGGSVEFVKNITRADSLILLTHIPLYRPDRSSCGSLRERGTIRKGVGHGYQNTLGKQTTEFLLHTLRPAVVFTGDNRDYCEYVHTGHWPVREVTVKSFSMSRHIKRPGFQLLSLTEMPNPLSERSFADTLCLLPNQQGIYLWLYLSHILIIFSGILILNLRQHRAFRTLSIDPVSLSPNPDTSNWRGGRSPLQPQVDSAIWSPYTPRNPVSPRNTLPRSLRTPQSAAGPTLRANTPQGSPLLAPMQYPPDEEESIDSVNHTHYHSHRIGYRHEGWTPEHELEDDEHSYFSTPGHVRSSSTKGYSWSRTFVFRGRRRRITVRIPRVVVVVARTVIGSSGENRTGRVEQAFRSILVNTSIDACRAFSPAVFLWLFLCWYIS